MNTCLTGTDTGSANAYACQLGRTLTQYEARACYAFVANATNTGASTVNFTSVGGSPMGARSIVKMAGGIATALVANDIRSGQIVHVCYDGTNMQMTSQPGTVPPAGGTPQGSPGQVQWNNAAAFAGTAGVTVSATDIVSMRYRPTTKTTTATLTTTDGPVVGCDTASGPVTLTLPAASGTQGMWSVVKTTSDANACNMQPGGADTINGGTSPVILGTQWERVDLLPLSTTGWHAAMSEQIETVPVVRSLFIPASALEVNGGCTVGAAAVLIAGGPKVTPVTCTDVDTDSVETDFVMPDGWNGGTITVELAVVSPGNNSGETLAMNFSGRCVRGNTDAVAAYAISSGATAESTSNVQALVTFPNATNREQHATTSALTLAGTCAGGAHVYLHGLIDAAATSLNPMSDGKIVGLKIEYTRNAAD